MRADEVRYRPEQQDRLIVAIERQAEAIEGHTRAIEGLVHLISGRLGDSPSTLYTSPPVRDGVVDERTMASMLSISNRTLAKYRRQGRFPNCWIRNAGRISWKVGETQEAWDRGIA